VKKIGVLKISHERYKGAKHEEEITAFHTQFDEAMKHNKDIKPHLNKAQVRFCLHLLSRVSLLSVLAC
jgi:hypothetical protein